MGCTIGSCDVIPTDWEPRDEREPLMEKIGCFYCGSSGSGLKFFEGKSVKDGDVLAYNKGVLFRVNGNNSKEKASENGSNSKKPLLTDEEIINFIKENTDLASPHRGLWVAGARWARDFYEKKRMMHNDSK